MEKQKKKKKEKMKRGKKKKKKNNNLIFSHVNLTFLLIGPYAFTHTHCTLPNNNNNNNCEEGSNLKVQFAPICFKLVPGPLSKVALEKIWKNENPA
jgi:hypothetical protein